MPDVKFINSPKSEKKRWDVTRKEVANSWFESHGFLVMPELNHEVEPQIQVICPRDFEYQAVDVIKFQREWEEVEGEFWEELEHYLPGAKKSHENVVVDVGRIGTISSSYWSSGHYYLRSDRSVGDLAAMMINHTLYAERKSLGVTWTKREALMDFIMTRPGMLRLFPHFKPIFAQLSRIPMKWRRYSEKYIETLGLPKVKQELELSNGKILIMGRVVGKELTKKEKQIMKLLVERKGELLTYDDLADSVWGEGEFKTFWAINKLLERLRIKLGKLGIDVARIKSVRGQGYLLE